MTHQPLLPFVLALALFTTSCGADGSPSGATETPEFLTVTLPATNTSEPTQTPLPPSALPTIPPVEGTTTTQVNVRAGPSTASAVMGIIPASMKVVVQGKDASGTWYQLLFAEGKGWVIAQYIQVNAGVEVPVISVGADPGSSSSVLVVQRVNVRTGPGTQFETVGNLIPNDVVALTGKDSSGAWLQIEYASAPEATGWINAEFVRASGVDAVPVVAEASPATGTESAAGSTPVPMAATAVDDGDSANAPSFTTTFSPAGARVLQFSSAVSAPEGDHEDWIQFTSHGPRVKISLTCSGNSAALLELAPAETSIEIGCGETKLIAIVAGETYLLRMAAPGEGERTFTAYTVKLEQLP